MELVGKKILVVGMAKSGIASAIKLSQEGAKVFVSDNATGADTQERAKDLAALSIESHLGPQGAQLLDGVDLVVISPGVPSDIDLIKRAKDRSIDVVSEIELAYRLGASKGFIIAITGTNGKTTTTTLIGKMYDKIFKTKVAGNIGDPLISVLSSEIEDTKFVIELSSFQLENIRHFKADIAILLNVTNDHLDRYNSFEDYREAKGNIFLTQTPSDYAILNIDDPQVAMFATRLKSKVFPTSKYKRLSYGAYVDSGKIIFCDGTETKEVCSISDLKLKGEHNLDNVMAAASAALLGGVPLNVVQDILLDFEGLSHRIEYVGEIEGASYYDDSKATNPDAVIKALTAFSEPIILIAGGRNKGYDFDSLALATESKVKMVILIGEAAPKMAESFTSTSKNLRFAKDLDEAVSLAAEASNPGDVVLLSPACSSFDMFLNYKERGEAFKQAFRKAKKEHENDQKRS